MPHGIEQPDRAPQLRHAASETSISKYCDLTAAAAAAAVAAATATAAVLCIALILWPHRHIKAEMQRFVSV